MERPGPRFTSFNEHGSRPPVVFIQGWPEEDEHIAALAARLGEDQPLYAVGLPTIDECNELRTMRGHVAYLKRALDNLPIEPPYVLFGWSFGGILAFEVAAHHPADVARVIVLDSMFVRWGHWRSRVTWYRAARAATRATTRTSLFRFLIQGAWGEMRTVGRRMKTEAAVEREHRRWLRHGGTRSLTAQINWSSQNILKEHYVREISTPITMVTIAGTISRVGFDPGDAWEAAAGNTDVTRVLLQGSHYSIWQDKYIGQLVELIRQETAGRPNVDEVASA